VESCGPVKVVLPCGCVWTLQSDSFSVDLTIATQNPRGDKVVDRLRLHHRVCRNQPRSDDPSQSQFVTINLQVTGLLL
jgi:hypothetical protein